MTNEPTSPFIAHLAAVCDSPMCTQVDHDDYESLGSLTVNIEIRLGAAEIGAFRKYAEERKVRLYKESIEDHKAERHLFKWVIENPSEYTELAYPSCRLMGENLLEATRHAMSGPKRHDEEILLTPPRLDDCDV